MPAILNLTQHNATSDQIAAGVIEPNAVDKELIKRFLTFNDLPSGQMIEFRANALADVATCYAVDFVMIGGAPFLMSTLEKALREHCREPVYAFSKRVVQEVHNPDGSVTKVNTFRHEGFV